MKDGLYGIAAFVDAAMFYLQWSGINGESEEEIKRNGEEKLGRI